MDEYKYKNLLTLFNEALDKVSAYKNKKYNNVLDFITDDKKSAKFINDISFENEKIYSANNASEIAACRARHSVIAHLLGIVLGEFCGLYDTLSETLYSLETTFVRNKSNKDFINFILWAITSQNHDYGYYSNYIYHRIPIEELKLKYYLFSDTEHLESRYVNTTFSKHYAGILKNTYEQMCNYYKYAQYYHESQNETKKINHNDNFNKKSDHSEKNDHGILGALLLYDKLSILIAKEYNETKDKQIIELAFGFTTLIYKVACLTIAQHNIFKSKSYAKDVDYIQYNLIHLLYDSDYFIGLTEPILFLLSIVDSIEMIKCLSKKENDTKYLRTETVLKNVYLYVDPNNIFLDFRPLNKIIKDKNDISLSESFNSYKKNLYNLGSWMNLKVKPNYKKEKLVLHITYDNHKKRKPH